MLKKTYQHIALFENDLRLYDELVAIDHTIPDVLESVLEEVHSFDPTLIPLWEQSAVKSRLPVYLLHFVLPFYELLRNENKYHDAQLLTAELLSCFAWRTFDNCVDGHEEHKKAHLVSLMSCTHLIDYAQTITERNVIAEVQNHYRVMAEQAFRETIEPIEVENIWKKCSALLFVPEFIAELSDSSLTLFKNYVNYIGLAHDMEDIFSDIGSGTISLPIFWFREFNGHLNVESVKMLYEKAARVVDPMEHSFKTNDVKHKWPLTDRLLKRSRNVFHNNTLNEQTI